MTEQVAHNGFTLSPIGLGTFDLRGLAGVDAAVAALQAGYRIIDSAVNYENEGAMGRAIRDSGVARESVVFTSKLPGRHHAHAAALFSIEESLLRTGLDVIDLHLIHWPNHQTGQYVEAWKGLIEAQERGLVREIGVSNFLPEHLARIERETGVRPVVNQIELHPLFPQEEQLQYHREHGIITQAWSPIARGRELLTHPVLTEIAQARGASTSQVVLAWHVARGVVALPKSASPARQRENLAAADIVLSADEVAAITTIGRDGARLNNLNPVTHEEF